MQSSISTRQKQKSAAFVEKYGACTTEQLGIASSWSKVEKDLLLYGNSAFTSDGLDVEIWV